MGDHAEFFSLEGSGLIRLRIHLQCAVFQVLSGVRMDEPENGSSDSIFGFADTRVFYGSLVENAIILSLWITIASRDCSRSLRCVCSLSHYTASAFFLSLMSRTRTRSAGFPLYIITLAFTSTNDLLPSLCMRVVSYLEGRDSPDIRRL